VVVFLDTATRSGPLESRTRSKAHFLKASKGVASSIMANYNKQSNFRFSCLFQTRLER
jgi:hypothetical protein